MYYTAQIKTQLLTELFLSYAWGQNLSSSESESAPPPTCYVTSKENCLSYGKYSVQFYSVNINTVVETEVLSMCSTLKKQSARYVYCSPESEIRGKKKGEEGSSPCTLIADHFPESICTAPTTMEPLSGRTTLELCKILQGCCFIYIAETTSY